MRGRLLKHAGLLAIVAGSAMIAIPALAYTDTAPGAGAGVTPFTTTTQGLFQFTFTATFPDVPPGVTVTFSQSSGPSTAFMTQAEAATCTVSFNPPSATLDANHQASTVATLSGCAGQALTLVATGPQGQTVSTTVTVPGGFPNTSGSTPPFGWIVIGLGALLVALGVFGVTRRRSSAAAA